MTHELSGSQSVTMIWSSDGWCYVPDLKIRCKFRTDISIQEPWDGVIGMPEYVEHTTWKPFLEKLSIQDIQTKKLSRPKKHQQSQQP